MRFGMNNFQYKILSTVLILGLIGCDGASNHQGEHAHSDHGDAAEAEPTKGPHGGRLLIDGDFALELAIYETGVPPEFRVWVTKEDAPISPVDVEVRATLTRLGSVIDDINFAQEGDFLRGDTEIYEPHSFVVAIEVDHLGTTHRWQYDNFEGRTLIGSDLAEAFGLKTELAGPATIEETVTVYGRIVPITEQVREVSARFDGVIESMNVSVGQNVRQGQTLAMIESDESLKSYPVPAPIKGVVTERAANPGEQTNGRRLFTIMDTTSVWVELAVFPSDLPRVQKGAPASVKAADGELLRSGAVSWLNVSAESNQSVLARVVLDNTDGAFVPGSYVTGEIRVAEYAVPLAVKRTGLQSFRDFTVVYAQIGDEYEVRMLELGRQGGEWVEVLGGLDPGTRYVTENSYVIKADIEKSGASHDH
jgi:cobalt-zinc-cadmium efflux system membrane fusion protein